MGKRNDSRRVLRHRESTTWTGIFAMAAARLEHANITVSDPDRTAALFEKLCGWHEQIGRAHV